MKNEWAVAGQAAKLRRKSAQSARTTAKKAQVRQKSTSPVDVIQLVSGLGYRYRDTDEN